MKYNVSISTCVIIIMPHLLYFTVNAQVYSDEDLLRKGSEFYAENNFGEAAAFLFAYIQRAPLRLSNDAKFETKIKEALLYSTTQIHTALKSPKKQNEGISEANMDQGNPHSAKPPLTSINQYQQNFQGDLGGKWSCNKIGGTYYIRKVGDEVWWFGTNQGEDVRWSNVFYGKIQGNKIYGEWVNVPFGKPSFSDHKGRLTVQILGPRKLVALGKKGELTETEWILE